MLRNALRVLTFEAKCDKMKVVQVLEAHEATTQTLSTTSEGKNLRGDKPTTRFKINKKPRKAIPRFLTKIFVRTTFFWPFAIVAGLENLAIFIKS